MDELTMYVSIDEIQKQVIHMSKKKLRKFVCQYLPVKKIGNRLYVSRSDLEKLLQDPDRGNFPLTIGE